MANERLLLANVLDALDDLHDQRERAAWWTERLLIATAAALSGSLWEKPMSDAAAALNVIRLGGPTGDEAYRASLAATDALRHRLAEEA